MFAFILKRLPLFAVPLSVLAAAAFSVPLAADLSPGRYELFLISPYLIAALAMFLSVHFHRGRPFMALLLLMAFYWVSRSYFVGKSIEPALNELYQAFVLLFPVNIALIVLMKERGIFTPAARVRFVFLGIQFVTAYWFFRYNFIASLPVLAANLGIPDVIAPSQVPQPAVLAGSVSLVLIAVMAIRRQTPLDAGLLGVLAAFCAAANSIDDQNSHTLFSAAGALIITLSVIRDSYNMAFRDDLTNLPSRRSLNESLNGLGRKYALAMLDVDHFKKFNDTYGHDVGDQVLKMVALKMMAVGGGGRAFRYGGEEFTILFPGRSAKEVVPELEKLRLSIAEYRMALRSAERPKNSSEGKPKRGSGGKTSFVSVTISIGVAERGENDATPQEVMKTADKALYRAKNLGRNQVCA